MIQSLYKFPKIVIISRNLEVIIHVEICKVPTCYFSRLADKWWTTDRKRWVISNRDGQLPNREEWREGMTVRVKVNLTGEIRLGKLGNMIEGIILFS